jgi:DNA-damage-inducible protein J
MATKNITIRMDEELKEQSEKLFTALGMNMTTAITTFIKQAVREQGIPFNITLEVPNKETREAIMESEKLIANPNTKKYTNLDDLFR